MGLVLWLAVWLRRLVLMAIVVVLGLGAPIAYTEITCRAPAAERPADAPTQLGAEARAYASLPAYAIARAYEDYADTLSGGEPHDFAYFAHLVGIWRATCATVEGADRAGGLPISVKIAVYGDSAAFSFAMAAKAAYEETLGRLAVMVRGPERAALDSVSAAQAQAYSLVRSGPPGIEWDYRTAAQELNEQRSGSLRDWERLIALNIEYRVGGWLRQLATLPGAPAAPTTLRAVIAGLDEATLAGIPGVEIVGPRSEGIQIETFGGTSGVPTLTEIARAGGSIAEIGGARQVLLSVTATEGEQPEALAALPTSGGSGRVILQLAAEDLAPALLRYADGAMRAERLLGN